MGDIHWMEVKPGWPEIKRGETYGGDGPELGPAIGRTVTIFLQVLGKCEGAALAIEPRRVTLFVRIYQTFACVVQSDKSSLLKLICFGERAQGVNSGNTGKG